MIVLDTDHLSILMAAHRSGHAQLRARMQAATDRAFAITIVSVEEHMRGWLAEIRRLPKVHDQIGAYERLEGLFDFFYDFELLSFNRHAADEFERLRKAKARIATMDLKIAAIALANDALLVSANRRDFGQVPGLRLQNWLDN